MKRLAYVLGLVVAGCGGQAVPSAGYGAKGESDLAADLEAKAAEMERELASLEPNDEPNQQTGDEDRVGAADADGESPAPVEEGAGSAPPPPAAAPATAAEVPEPDDAQTKKRDGCKTACRALGSMKRSEARICELVGEGHDKCTWAHERVKDAVLRIERARCSCKD